MELMDSLPEEPDFFLNVTVPCAFLIVKASDALMVCAFFAVLLTLGLLLFTEIGLTFLGSFGTALVSFSPHLLQVLVSLPSAVVVAAFVVHFSSAVFPSFVHVAAVAGTDTCGI